MAHEKTNTSSTNATTSAAPSSAAAINWVAVMMLLEFIARVLHFVVGLAIVRFMTPDDYGKVSLQLPLITSASTRIMKETLHRAAVVQQGNMVLVWWSIPLGIAFSGCVGFWYLLASEEVALNPWMYTGFMCWLIAGWIEMAIEPVIIYAERNLLMRVIAGVQCAAILGQSGAMILLILFGPESMLVLVTAYGQLAYAVVIGVGFYGYAVLTNPHVFKELWPKNWSLKPGQLVAVSGLFIQSLGKYVTAEGEHLILFFFGTAEQQGIYEFVHNLGAIVARIAFQSIEKTGFVYFARLKDKEHDSERRKIWGMLLGISFLISLLYLSTCPSYIHFLVHLVYGTRWSSTSAPNLLSFYGIYLMLIGINGLVESLRDATSPDALIRSTWKFTVFTIVFYFAAGSVAMHFYGAAGLIGAACISVLMRCTFNISYFRQYVFPITDGIPPSFAWLVCVLLLVVGTASRWYFGDTWKHLIVGGASSAVLGGLLLLFQRERLSETWRLIRSSKAEKTE